MKPLIWILMGFGAFLMLAGLVFGGAGMTIFGLLMVATGVFFTVGAMAVGAALFSWLGPEKEPPTISVMEFPNLSESQVLGLAKNYFELSHPDGMFDAFLGGATAWEFGRHR